MRINSIDTIQRSKINSNYSYNNSINQVGHSDSFINNSNFIAGNNFSYFKKGNVTRIVSFLGAVKIEKPEEPEYYDDLKFKMKIGGNEECQETRKEITDIDAKKNKKINFELDKDKEEVKLYYEKTGKLIGFIHLEVLKHVYDEMEQHPEDFKIELANVIKFPGHKKIGIKTWIKYTGENQEAMKTLFKEVLDDPKCKQITYPPVSPESPENLLKTMLKYEEQINGTKSKNDMQFAIDNIAREIKDPKNKNILLLGHKDPDGDCIGSLLGMKNAIDLMGTDKKVDCSVDDRVPLLFKYLKDIKEIRLPDKNKLVNAVSNAITTLNDRGDDAEKVSIFETVKDNISKNNKSLPKEKIYDLVILMDVAAPDRLGSKFAKYIDPNKTKIIFIDHHQKRFDEWNKSKDITNIDMKKINQNHLAWVIDRVPAAALMVSVIAGKLNPEINSETVYNKYSPKEQNILKNMAAGILTGVSTDTSRYKRSAELLTEDKLLPRYERPRYNPLGVAKWFSLITNRNITRSYVESNMDEQSYKIKGTKKLVNETLGERTHKNNELRLGYVQIEKEYLDNIWMDAAKNSPDATFRDIVGTIKSSIANKRLKRSASYATAENPKPQDDAIAYVVTQSEIKGELNSGYNVSTENKLTFSFRSQEGTNDASILASLFGGGGHGPAAGGRVAGENIGFDSKLLVLVDGKVEENSEEVLKALNKNFELGNSAMSEEERNKYIKEVKVIKSPDSSEGRTSSELIEDIVREIRKNQESAKVDSSDNLIEV